MFDVVFEPVMQMINEQFEAQKPAMKREHNSKYGEEPFEGDEDGKSPSKMTSPEKKVFK